MFDINNAIRQVTDNDVPIHLPSGETNFMSYDEAVEYVKWLYGRREVLSNTDLIRQICQEEIEKALKNFNTDTNDYYTNSEKVPQKLGGVDQNTTFNNIKVTDILTMLLYPYQLPAITSFSTPKLNFDLGESTGSSMNFSWNISNAKNLKENSIVLKYNNKIISLNNEPSSATNKTFTIPETKNNNQSSIICRLEAKNSKDQTISSQITLSWLNCIYYGISNDETIDETKAKSFQKVKSNSVARQYSYNAGGYKYLVIPSIWSDPTSFVDPATNFDVPMKKLDNIEITNNFNVTQSYKVFRSINLLNGSIKINVK